MLLKYDITYFTLLKFKDLAKFNPNPSNNSKKTTIRKSLKRNQFTVSTFVKLKN